VLARYGHALETASKDKEAGILEVKTHLKGPNGKPSIFLLDNCLRTLYEIEGYMWEKETNKPADIDDHMMENLYRTLLLQTKYVDIEDYRAYGDAEGVQLNRNKITGY